MSDNNKKNDSDAMKALDAKDQINQRTVESPQDTEADAMIEEISSVGLGKVNMDQFGQARPDKKGRGGFLFDDDKFQYNCFNCNYKTGWSPQSKITIRLKNLLVTLGADESDIQRIQLELLREQDVETLLIKTEKRKNLFIDWDEKKLPDDAKPFMDFTEPNADWTEAVAYLTDRGFDVTDSGLFSGE